MFSKNMSDAVKTRAGQAAAFNTETVHAEVKKVYTDGIGNVTHADVRVDGETEDLRKVENASGINLYNGSSITLNYARGNRFGTVIIGAGDGGTGANIAGNNAGQTDGLGGTTDTMVDLSGVPFLLTEGSPDVVPDGLVLTPGANVLMEDTPASVVSGGIIPAKRTVSAKTLVVTVLPDPVLSGLPSGTLADLVDSYGNPLGMYRLDVTAGVWRRRDKGMSDGGGSASIERNTTIATTVSLANLATDITTQIGTGRLISVYEIETSHAAWVRIYSSEAKMLADVNRLQNVDPSGDHGVLCEVVTTASQLVLGSPQGTASLVSRENPVRPLFMRVKNLSGGTTAITVTLRHIPIESEP